MTQKDLFGAKFNEREFCKFANKLLPDFAEERRPIAPSKILTAVRLLGTSPTCQLAIITARVDQDHTRKRVEITQEAFRILRRHRIRNALVAFYADEDGWRLSLLTSTLKIEQGKVVGQTSNPKRYSYLLGPKAKIKTPTKLLREQGKVANLDELKARFSVEVVNKDFYQAIARQFVKLVGGERGEGRARRVYQPQLILPAEHQGQANEFAVRLIGRLIFCWFLKEKQSAKRLSLMPQNLLSAQAVNKHPDYYHNVLEPVFFECLNTKFEQREAIFQRAPFEQIPYLNGGLFNPQRNDFYKNQGRVEIADEWFRELFQILEQYNFTVDENTELDVELSIDPEMLGKIFENLLAEISPETGESARKATGSFYTPREIVSYMVDEALYEFLKGRTRIETEKLKTLIRYKTGGSVELTTDGRQAIVDALAELKILDPACGSGAFPIGILQKVFYILQQVDPDGSRWYEKQIECEATPEITEDLRTKFNDGNCDYIRKLGIIRQSIFGVDIQPIATEITKLRCFLTLVIEETVDDAKPNRGIQPLPNLDFKFVTANTLKFLPENPNDPLNMFETGSSVELVRKVRSDYFLADKTGRAFLKAEFGEAQNVIAETRQEVAAARYKNLATWKPFANQQTDWFDSRWMFGVDNFDIVIGNPPYGATLTKTEQKYCLRHYKAAQSVGELKGSLDTFALFVERGLGMLKTGGSLALIVPMAITSNETMTALQKELEEKCERMKIASFTNRPQQIFENACVRTSIIFCKKMNTSLRELYMSKPMRRESGDSIQNVIENLEFVEAHKYKLYGRYPKIGNEQELKILGKIFQAEKCVQDYADPSSKEEFYYRAAGGRYFNIVTLAPTGTSAERAYRAQNAELIAACLSTSLFWFYQQVYTDGLNLKDYEIDQFPLPDFEKVDQERLEKIRETYARYLSELEVNASTKNATRDSRYNVQRFKEYKVAKSKTVIDELDDLTGPLYGLSEGEVDYIKSYEENTRMRGSYR